LQLLQDGQFFAGSGAQEDKKVEVRVGLRPPNRRLESEKIEAGTFRQDSLLTGFNVVNITNGRRLPRNARWRHRRTCCAYFLEYYNRKFQTAGLGPCREKCWRCCRNIIGREISANFEKPESSVT